jgi:hypothetical protein
MTTATAAANTTGIPNCEEHKKYPIEGTLITLHCTEPKNHHTSHCDEAYNREWTNDPDKGTV